MKIKFVSGHIQQSEAERSILNGAIRKWLRPSDRIDYDYRSAAEECCAPVRFCSGLTNICLRCYHINISNKVSDLEE